MSYHTPHYIDGDIKGVSQHKRKAGNPYPQSRRENGTFAPALRSLTLKDKIKRKFPHRVYASLSAKEHQTFKELSRNLNVSMSDIMAYLITNHLEQLAHQASFELGQQSVQGNNLRENPSL